MLKVLLQKQLKEFKYSYFRDKKTGRPRSKKATIGFLILYIFLFSTLLISIFGITMGIRKYVDKKEDMWIMFAIMTFLTLFVSTFINMLITRGILFEAKDNELMLSLPIPDKYIVMSRMLNVFINTFIYTFLMWVPAFINYFIFHGFDILVFIYGIILYILITCIVVSLSCLFGYGISILMKKIPMKNFIQTFITLIFLAAYYVIYFSANRIMTAMLLDLNKFEATMKTKGIFIYAFAKAATGDSLYFLISIGFSILVCAICFAIIIRRYRNLLVSTPSNNKKEFKGSYNKQLSIGNTLINREVKRFFSNSTYTLNCGLGVVILGGASIALIIFNGKIKELLPLFEVIPFLKDALPIAIICAMSLIASLDALSVPAVSLEGKNYWIIRSLPVNTYDVLNSKRTLQFRMHVIPIAILAVLCSMFFEMEGLTQVAFVICACTSCMFITYCDLFLGIKGANLKWNDEIFVIKQSGNVFIAIFGGMILYGGIIPLYIFVLSKYINSQIFMICLIVIFVAVSMLIDKWVRNKGVKLFEDLG